MHNQANWILLVLQLLLLTISIFLIRYAIKIKREAQAINKRSQDIVKWIEDHKEKGVTRPELVKEIEVEEEEDFREKYYSEVKKSKDYGGN